MLSNISIKSLYTLALAEEEGVGTAYEYFAKRLVLAPWLAQMVRPQHILVAGLPQKYGYSLDWLQVAAELGAAVTVIDERADKLARMEAIVAAVQAQGWLTEITPVYQAVPNLTELEGVNGRFDLILSAEVMQRLQPDARQLFFNQLCLLAPALALFAPNADNPSHTSISGLDGLHLGELEALPLRVRSAGIQPGRSGQAAFGYIDMPPFPPGIVRSDEQREQATSGRLEALAMWGLAYYARLEKWCPRSIRRRQAHIVYMLLS
ncbi:MAG: hypothetical protein R6X32_07260 [Chloroflexota bacterium]|jgi:hypothetical protein